MFMYKTDTDSSGYDTGRLYAFEHDKLAQVQRLLTESGARVQGIMQKYSDPVYKDIVAELGQEFTQFRQAVTQVLIAPMPGYQMDPFQELQLLQREKQQGYEKLSELNDEIQRLREQRDGSNRLIEELQTSNKDANGTESGNSDPPYSTPLNFDDSKAVIDSLTSELETAQMNVGDLRRTVDELTSQNKRLTVEVLQLRDQVNQSYMPNLNANNIFDNGNHANANANQNTQGELQRLTTVVEQLRVENNSLKEDNKMKVAKIEDLSKRLGDRGGPTSHLFRNDTVTEWDKNDLDALKAEMNKQKVALMTDRAMYHQTEEEHQMAPINEDTESGAGMNGHAGNVKALFRNDTKTEWDQSELDKLKDELMSHLQKENLATISRQFEQQMRYPEEQHATNLVSGADQGTMSIDEMKNLQKQMKAELTAQNNAIIMQRTDKAFALRQSANKGVLDTDDFEAAQAELEKMKAIEAKEKLKKQLFRNDDFVAAEPTADQYEQLNDFLKNTMGLLNENIRTRTINELKAMFTDGGANNLSGARGSEPQTPMVTGTAQPVSNSLLGDAGDDADAELLASTYPTPGGPTPGGPDDLLTPGGPTPGGPTPGGPTEYDQLVQLGVLEPPASQTEWAKISEDQTTRINQLKKELFSRNSEINALRVKIGTLESEVMALKEQIDGTDRNGYGNGGTSREVIEMKQEINDLKNMKLQLIKSTAKEMDHLRNMIRDMQRRINNV